MEFSAAFPQTNSVLEAILLRTSQNTLQASPAEVISRIACAKALLDLQPEMDEVAAAQLQQILTADSLAKWTHQIREAQALAAVKPAAVQSVTLIAAQKRLSSKKRSNLNSDARRVLVSWLQANARNPYPTEVEKEQLALDADVSKEQITNFFINARGRSMWKEIAEQQGLTTARDSETNKWYAE